jgi:hypothetical protein
MAVQAILPSIAIRAGWAALLAVIFLPLSSVLASAWALKSTSVILITPNTMRLSRGSTAPTKRSASRLYRPTDLEQACQDTEIFVKHSNLERPHQGLSCGNRPPCIAFPTPVSLLPLPGQVDPDGWLAPLDGLHLERHPWIDMV